MLQTILQWAMSQRRPTWGGSDAGRLQVLDKRGRTPINSFPNLKTRNGSAQGGGALPFCFCVGPQGGGKDPSHIRGKNNPVSLRGDTREEVDATAVRHACMFREEKEQAGRISYRP